MKKAIVWFFVVGYCLLPVWLKIPVIGEYLAVFFVFFPVLFFAVVYVPFIYLPNSTYEPSSFKQHCDARDKEHAERQKAERRRVEALARSDWRFDHGRMYHSRDHWD
ncbi:hypothetical protein AB4090_02455 [Acidithiobacillus sp. IBUN Pt1247-S3]|uniref:hypothetical protein n=1 Tax=Acidithiobacillus sp. IBUN Pt1247-S3 TaxID=3166642 RepID=UPI0034E4D9B9